MPLTPSIAPRTETAGPSLYPTGTPILIRSVKDLSKKSKKRITKHTASKRAVKIDGKQVFFPGAGPSSSFGTGITTGPAAAGGFGVTGPFGTGASLGFSASGPGGAGFGIGGTTSPFGTTTGIGASRGIGVGLGGGVTGPFGTQSFGFAQSGPGGAAFGAGQATRVGGGFGPYGFAPGRVISRRAVMVW